jgi:hypothetical protein
MIIRLERVTFNHDPADCSVDAFNIRVDHDTKAKDWVHGATTPSPAAYALAATVANTLTIQAQFSFSGGTPGPSVSVRAQPVSADDAPLGSVLSAPVVVPAAGATTAPVAFTLEDPGFRTTGAGRYPMSWQWQVQLTQNGAWLDFDRSDHVIYVTLAVPAAPWTQSTGASHQVLWPWTRVLDWACVWAKGVKRSSTSAGKAAGLVETNLYALGSRASSPLVYSEDASFSSQGVFFCSEFLESLEGLGPSGSPVIVNCTDCASALVVFANAFGCDLGILSVTRTDDSTFKTNPIVPIGTDSPDQPEWGVHTFAVRPAASRSSRHVHDACLMIDRDSDPTVSKKAAFGVSKGLALGNAAAPVKGGQFKYVHRLVRPSDVTQCATKIVHLPDIDERAPTDAVPVPIVGLWTRHRKEIDLIARHAGDDTPPLVDLEPMPIPGFFAYHRVNSPLHFSLPRGLVNPSVEFFYVSTRPADTQAESSSDERLRVSIGYAETSEHARDALAWLMTQSDANPGPLLVEDGRRIGDAAFATSRQATALFVRGRTVARVRSVGRDRIAVVDLARSVDDVLRLRMNNALRL